MRKRAAWRAKEADDSSRVRACLPAAYPADAVETTKSKFSNNSMVPQTGLEPVTPSLRNTWPESPWLFFDILFYTGKRKTPLNIRFLVILCHP